MEDIVTISPSNNLVKIEEMDVLAQMFSLIEST